MNVSRVCDVIDLNWALVPDLATRLKKLGWSITETSIEIRRHPDTLGFDSIEEACENVRSQGPPTRYWISFTGRTGGRSKYLSLHRSSDKDVSLKMSGIGDRTELDSIMEFLGLVPVGRTSKPTQGGFISASRSCKVCDLNWAILPDLVTRLEKQGWSITETSVEVRRYPDKLEFDSIEEACKNVRDQGAPPNYTVWLHGEVKERSCSLRLSRFKNVHNEKLLVLDMSGIKNISELDSIMDFLGLVSDELSPLPPPPPRTAFIAHRFDRVGTDTADRIARFLEFLGFNVITGRGYFPGSIREKVLARIEEQATVFAILTPGTDDAWLVQESVISEIKGKPLFILKEHSVAFKAGILADHEFIPFDASNIEATFIPILEGLRELGYLKQDE